MLTQLKYVNVTITTFHFVICIWINELSRGRAIEVLIGKKLIFSLMKTLVFKLSSLPTRQNLGHCPSQTIKKQ